jgi:hypothetical protein
LTLIKGYWNNGSSHRDLTEYSKNIQQAINRFTEHTDKNLKKLLEEAEKDEKSGIILQDRKSQHILVD